MSKAVGRRLSDDDWVGSSHQIGGYTSPLPLLPLTDHAREKILNQLGRIMSSLLKPRFDKIGSLFQNEEGKYYIGECLSPSLLWQLRDTLPDIARGPFDKEDQYFGSLISAFVSHAKSLSIAPHGFFAPIPNLMEYAHCIAGQFLQDMISRLSSGEMALFFLTLISTVATFSSTKTTT